MRSKQTQCLAQSHSRRRIHQLKSSSTQLLALISQEALAICPQKRLAQQAIGGTTPHNPPLPATSPPLPSILSFVPLNEQLGMFWWGYLMQHAYLGHHPRRHSGLSACVPGHAQDFLRAFNSTTRLSKPIETRSKQLARSLRSRSSESGTEPCPRSHSPTSEYGRDPLRRVQRSRFVSA